MATNGSIECDDSVCFKLSECDVQYGGGMPDLEERLYSPVGLPCVLFDDAAVKVEHTVSDMNGILTCGQPEGSIADGQVNSGLETSDEHGTLTGVKPDGSISDGQVISGLEEYMEVAATSEPAIGSSDEISPFDDLPFASVQAALRSV